MAEVIQLPTAAEPTVQPVPQEQPRRLPIIGEAWQRANLLATVTQIVGLHWYRARFHGARLHWYTLLATWFALVGSLRLAGRWYRWVSWPEGKQLESVAVAAGRAGHAEAMRAHTVGKETRAARWWITGVSAASALVAAVAALHVIPVWGWPPLAAAAVVALARHGKPEGRPLIGAAVVSPKYEPPTPQVITRALASLQIAGINEVIRDGRGISFVSDVHRDGEGWGCDLDLPHGVTAGMILAKREQFASGLRRPLSATWPEPVPAEHEGRLRVWIGFQDISKVKPRPWPLLRAGASDVFGHIPFGTDPRGREQGAPLFEVNYLIGAAPGQGKTSAVRVLACGAALDTLTDLWIHELAGKGDLEPLAKVCHRYTSGLDDEAVGYAAASVTMLRRDLEDRSAAFKKLPREMRPDGKVTREIASRHRALRPRVCVIDECQNLFMHPEFGKQATEDAAHVIRLGRAYGIVLVLATQRPDSVALPTAISGNVTARFCLRVPGQVENDIILGTGAYKNGYRATVFRAKTDAGLGWLKGDGDPQILKTYYLNDQAAERVAARARAMRERAGVLSGYALGQDAGQAPRDVLGDVLEAFGNDLSLQWETLAERLAARFPERWADVSGGTASQQCRDLGVPSVQVKSGGVNRQGCRRDAVQDALSARSAP